MPVTMSGIASGIDTDAIVEKLLKVESKPIETLQNAIKKNRVRKDALILLKKHLKELNNRAKDLYGFNASYNEKAANSSNSDVLRAVASKNAVNGLKSIEIMQIASAHKIVSDKVDHNKELPAGKFTIEVNGESIPIRFKGGKLKNLREQIDEAASGIVNTSYIRTTDDDYIITLESKVYGKKGEMKIKGKAKVLNEIGLISKEKIEDKKGSELVFDRRYFTSYLGDKKLEKQDGKIVIGKDGKKVNISGMLWQEYVLPVQSAVKNNSFFEFDFTYKKPVREDKDFPFRVEMGPRDRINIRGIELEAYNVSRIRPKEEVEKKKPFENILGVGIVSESKGKRIEKIYPVEIDSKGKQEIPIGRDFENKKISKIIFFCNDGTAEFSKARLVTPVEMKGQLMPKNVIAEAKNARLKIDGIEITRDKNNALTDVIKGVTLDLKAASEIPVSLKIEPDFKKSIEKINSFVEAYNKYLDFHKDLLKSEKVDKPVGSRKKRYRRGIFAGDMAIIRLENSIKRVIGNAYPNHSDNPIKILPQIGITTGKINADWETIREGKLVVDTEILRKIIIENPNGIRLFFGSDSDGDNRIDTGLAYSLVNSLKPYISYGKNVISSKIGLEEDSIKSANDKIEKREEYLANYEKKLKRKFGRMERAISGANSQKNWLNNTMKSNDDK